MAFFFFFVHEDSPTHNTDIQIVSGQILIPELLVSDLTEAVTQYKGVKMSLLIFAEKSALEMVKDTCAAVCSALTLLHSNVFTMFTQLF